MKIVTIRKTKENRLNITYPNHPALYYFTRQRPLVFIVTVREWKVVNRNTNDFLFIKDLLCFDLRCFTCAPFPQRVRRYPEKCNVNVNKNKNKNNLGDAKRILTVNNRLIILRKSVL